MNNRDRVSINILHYNSYEKTKACIASCLRQKNDGIQIVVIDNKSTNDSLSELKNNFSNEDILFLENDKNYGYAKGNNIGVEFALKHGYRYSLILNNDTELVGDSFVNEMVQVISCNKSCAVVAPAIYDVTQNGLELLKNDSVYHKLLRGFGVLPQNKTISSNLSTVSEAQGSALFVDNELFLQVGGFPEHYFMYGEEGTFAKKVLWNNNLIIWDTNPEVYVLHHHDKSKKVEDWRLYLMGRNRAIEYMENRNKRPINWTLVFILFYIRTYITGNKEYLNGMSDGIKLVRHSFSKDQIFESAIEYAQSHRNVV